jgi:hypothetical protein
VCTEEGKLHLLVAISRASNFAYVEWRENSDRKVSTAFLRRLIEAVPYKILLD